MIKKIEIEGKTLYVSRSAMMFRLYKRIFGKDLISEFAKYQDLLNSKEELLNEFDFQIFENILYIMYISNPRNFQYDINGKKRCVEINGKKIIQPAQEITIGDFLNYFDNPQSIIKKAADIMEIAFSSISTTNQPKNKGKKKHQKKKK